MTTETEWMDALAGLPSWSLRNGARHSPIVVLAPHPDDETLGAGGLIESQSRQGGRVEVIAVTDGEAAYKNCSGLGELRRQEQERALQELGVEGDRITRLKLPDSAVSLHEDQLAASIHPHLSADTLLVAPWKYDPHPDHEATGRAAEKAASLAGATLISYLFWTWHWRDTDAFAGIRLVRFELDEKAQAARGAAISRHRSQLEHESGSPILPDELLVPARRPFETFILHD